MRTTGIRTNLLVILAIVISGAMAQSTPGAPLLADFTITSTQLGKVGGAFLKVSIIICFLLMIVDAIMRFGGSVLGICGMAHTTRFIWFVYGISTIYYLGNTVVDGYRGFNDGIFLQLFECIFEGYFGSGYIKIFNSKIEVAGVAQDHSILLENVIFFELIVFICLRIGALALSSGLKVGNPVAHLLGTLRRIFGFFFALYFLFHGLNFFQIMSEYRILEDATPGTVTGRAKFNVILSYIVAGYVFLEVIWVIVEVLLAALGAGASRSGDYQEGTNPGVVPSVMRSYDNFIEEVAFMFQRKNLAVLNPMAKFYNFCFFLKWLLIVCLCVIWKKQIRTMYVLIGVVEFIHLVHVVLLLISGTFRNPAGILITLSSALTFIRIFCNWLHFQDQFGSTTLGPTTIAFYGFLVFVSHFFNVLAEFVLLFEPLYGGVSATPGGGVPKAVSSFEVQGLESEHENELINRVSTYKDMKS